MVFRDYININININSISLVGLGWVGVSTRFCVCWVLQRKPLPVAVSLTPSANFSLTKITK